VERLLDAYRATLIISKENDIYTINLDLNTAQDGGGGGVAGKISGVYTGYLTVE
jgi:hypothetical protein